MSLGSEDAENLATWWAEKLETVDETLVNAGVTSAWWSFGLGADVIVQNADDIEQCLTVIATTPRGVDPHRPGFASNIYDYLDRPIPQATPFVIRELITAVERWEPRIALDALSVEAFSPDIAGVTVRADWSIPQSTVESSLRIEVTRAV